MFLTQIINGQATELALCEACAKAKGLFDPQSLTFAEKFFPEEFRKRVDKLIKELSQSDDKEPEAEGIPTLLGEDSLTQCPVCHFTLEQYRRTGRLGCPDCYRVFDKEIHADEKPTEASSAESTVEQEHLDPRELRRRLEQQLAQAIKREDYEEAARLRDRIHDLA